MLQNSFFTILQAEHTPGFINARLSINKEHAILKGHFPSRPIVPGVCMMQLIKELVEVKIHRTLVLTEAENIKFLSIIDPTENNEVEATIAFVESEENIILNASLFRGPVIFFKLKATLQIRA